MKTLVFMVLLGLALPPGFLSAAPPQDPAPAAQEESAPKAAYDALLAEFESAQKEFFALYRETTGEAERKKLVEEKYPKPEKFAPRFLALAEKHPKDPVAAECLVWVMDSHADPKASGAAMDALLRNHLESPVLAKAAQSLAYDLTPKSETFLRTLLEKSPHQEVKGQACYALAKVFGNRSETILRFRGAAEAEEKEWLVKKLGEEGTATLLASDPSPMEKESEKLLERVVAEFGGVESYRGTLGDAAKGDLFEMRTLGIGKAAPEIEGEDVDGKKFKLSDYKGKVVFLDFWGNW